MRFHKVVSYEDGALEKSLDESMTLRKKAIRGTILLVGGQTTVMACRFVRNLIVARLLTKADYGIAATFALTISTLEMITYLSVDKIVVQSKHGDNPSFQAVAHFIQVIRGLLMAMVLVLLAWPIATLFKIPEARWAFYYLAVIPFTGGFTHLDICRMQRKLVVWPKVAMETVPQIVVTLIAWPLTVWLKDYSAFLWLLILAYVLTVAASHVLAERRYRLTVNMPHVKQMFHFAYPLLFSSVIMFGTLQGDRYIIGTLYTMEDLAVYSLAFMFVMVLEGPILQIVQTIMLPLLAGVQDSPSAFEERYTLCTQVLAMAAAIFGALLIVPGELLVSLLYGEEYRVAGVIVGWLAGAQALRLIRVGPVLGAMAKADTKTSLFANMIRSSGIVLAFMFALMRFSLSWIAISALLGEIPALVFAAIRLSRVHRIGARTCLKPALLPVTILILSGIVSLYLSKKSGSVLVLLVTCTLILAALVWGIVSFHSLRRQLFRTVKDLCRRIGSGPACPGGFTK